MRASTEFKIEFIGLKITSFETILGQVTITSGQHSVSAPLQASITNPRLAWQREDALSDFVKVLDGMEISNKMTESSLITQFDAVVDLSWALRALELRQEAYKLCSIWHGVIRRLAAANPDKYQNSLARSL